MKKKKTKTQDTPPKKNAEKPKDIDFSVFDINRIEVSTNGEPLPFAIGDRFSMSEDDTIVKTIMSITIGEDGRTSYGLEWYDPADGCFKTELVTMSEIKLLVNNMPKKKNISLAE